MRHPPIVYSSLVSHKNRAGDELAAFATTMRSLGYDPRILRGDLGGEFDNSKFRKQAADLGMKVEYVSAERHVNSAEGAHLRIADVMRANNALTRGVLDLKFWGYSYMYAVNQINIAGGYFGADEDLTGCAPYGSLVAYYDLDLPKNQARASLGVYIGRRRDAGPGATWVVPPPSPAASNPTCAACGPQPPFASWWHPANSSKASRSPTLHALCASPTPRPQASSITRRQRAPTGPPPSETPNTI